MPTNAEIAERYREDFSVWYKANYAHIAATSSWVERSWESYKAGILRAIEESHPPSICGKKSPYHRPTSMYCLDCLPPDAPLGALLLSNREPTEDEVKRGLEIARELDERRKAAGLPSKFVVEESQVQQEPCAEHYLKLKEMTRTLVQKPPDPNKPGLVEAKQYVMFADAFGALVAAYKLGGGGDDTRELREAARQLLVDVRKFKNGWISAAVLEEKIASFEHVLAKGEPQERLKEK